MIDSLKQIGLSELEARCYLALHEAEALSGYEVAKRVSVSRTNVYAALRSLTDKGACRVIEGDPVRYDAVPIQQLVRLLEKEFQKTTQALVQELQAPPRTTPAFYNWQGDKPLGLAIRRLIANAERSVIVDIWAEDLPLVEEALVDAEHNGLTVVLIVIGDVRTPLQNVFHHQRNDDWPGGVVRKFSILCDNRSALLGSFGGAVKLSALETDHPAVLQVLQNAFYHDVLMQHIESDFGSQLTEKYGAHYEKLLHYYLQEKGWDFQ